MTKQRFTILYETEENAMEWDLIDNQEDRLIVTGNGKAICDLLNELHEENQDLATKKEDAEYELLYLKEKYEEVIEENDQLKSELSRYEEVNRLNIWKSSYSSEDALITELQDKCDKKQEHIVILENKIHRMREAIHKLEKSKNSQQQVDLRIFAQQVLYDLKKELQE